MVHWRNIQLFNNGCRSREVITMSISCSILMSSGFSNNELSMTYCVTGSILCFITQSTDGNVGTETICHHESQIA